MQTAAAPRPLRDRRLSSHAVTTSSDTAVVATPTARIGSSQTDGNLDDAIPAETVVAESASVTKTFICGTNPMDRHPKPHHSTTRQQPGDDRSTAHTLGRDPHLLNPGAADHLKHFGDPLKGCITVASDRNPDLGILLVVISNLPG
jgi:hypothetical protein